MLAAAQVVQDEDRKSAKIGEMNDDQRVDVMFKLAAAMVKREEIASYRGGTW